MTRIVRKSVDVKKVLAKPHQSWSERLMSWGLSKPAIAGIFIAIMGWIERAFAHNEENIEAWTVMGKATDSFQYSRRMVIISAGFVMIVSILLALFKKISWFWLFGLLSWSAIVGVSGLILDYMTTDIETDTDFSEFIDLVLIAAIVLVIALLPILITLIQYKIKKIDKKLLKHRLLIWLACGLLISGLLLFFYLLSLLG